MLKPKVHKEFAQKVTSEFVWYGHKMHPNAVANQCYITFTCSVPERWFYGA
jgi:hypothetical protein